MFMKKQGSIFLICMTAAFLLITFGFFIGRNHRSGDLTTERIPPVSQTYPVATVPAENNPFPINLNTADAELLMELPGIGEVLAERIVEYREEHGPFTSVNELLNIKDIGESRLEKLLPYITTGGNEE